MRCIQGPAIHDPIWHGEGTRRPATSKFVVNDEGGHHAVAQQTEHGN
eukprot:CAMPEP_0174361644 /NCGR_PEP_ID=MMETSP0811_2-20130205/60166_1 /TAXON_ID=73025 ORGANISM="Eutreptiella gymnastica-like, Strain CCMP1594" /NCGR_SAMPLE_ID=MMETSP0811_2 /ASSEMBLY_ACC=CAM_ASM_000667 /LENGTH=46 /DNA_ID= /DNA_START= /DNA_END= /DNA_ORIENTATION=